MNAAQWMAALIVSQHTQQHHKMADSCAYSHLHAHLMFLMRPAGST